MLPGSKKAWVVDSCVALFALVYIVLIGETIRLHRLLRNQASLTQPGGKRPRFMVQAGDTIDVRLRSLAGEASSLAAAASTGRVYVWLFDPGCPVCAKEAGEVAAVTGETQPGRFIAVSKGERAATEEFVGRSGLSMPVYLMDRSDQLGHRQRDARLEAVPQLFLLDEHHVVSVMRCPCELKPREGAAAVR